MVRWLSLWVMASVGGLVLACSSGGSSAGGPDGCEPGTSCNACQSCEQLCYCTTGNVDGCKVACEVNATGGSGGTGGVYPTGGTGGGGATGGSGGTTTTGGLATALPITQIDVNQGVAIPVMQNGSEPPKKAPVVADREVMFRIFVTPDADFQPREIVARVELGGSAPGSFEAKAFISGPSSASTQQSTLNVNVPAANIKPDTTYTVSLLEASGQSFPGANGGAKWGASALGAQSTNGAFQVVVVPVSIGGIVPKTDATSMKAYRDRLMKLYPAPDVDIQVRAVATYTGTVPQYNGAGWSQLLNWLMQLRSYDNVPGRSYYYGLIAPKSSFDQYCAYGCVAGLSNKADAQQDPVYRVGSGVGFFPSGQTPTTTDTMAHELGHTLGLAHAPCVMQGGQIDDVDPAYPYSGGGIGSWGWDNITKQFLDPGKYKDVMGYCDPYVHVADWTYNKLFQRIAYSNATGDEAPSNDPARAPGTFDSLVVEPDGTLSWGYPIETKWTTSAPEKAIALLDDSGAQIGTVKGFWYGHGHGGGGTLLVPRKALTALPHGQALELGGRSLALPLN